MLGPLQTIQALLIWLCRDNVTVWLFILVQLTDKTQMYNYIGPYNNTHTQLSILYFHRSVPDCYSPARVLHQMFGRGVQHAMKKIDPIISMVL